MQIDHLILFHKIASEKSISKVAEECHLSQPALSQQMRKLEEEIGLRLLDRSNRGIVLTNGGKVVYKYFQQIIETYENMLEEIKSLNHYSGTVRIFASYVVGQYALPCSIHKMHEKFPKFNFTLTTMSSSEVVRKITEEKGSIGFIVSSVNNPDLVCKHIYSDRGYLVCSEKFYKENTITLDKLKTYPMITMTDHFSSQRILNQTLKKAGHDISDFNILMNLDSTESLKASVIANLGFAILPYMSIKKEIYLKQLKIVEIPGFQVNYDLHMIFKKREDSLDTPA
ncbi:MAG: LysR family transcriptional regulator, partial [Bacillota bacterium]